MYSKNNSKDNKQNIKNIDKEKIIKSFCLKEVTFIKLKTIDKLTRIIKSVSQRTKIVSLINL